MGKDSQLEFLHMLQSSQGCPSTSLGTARPKVPSEGLPLVLRTSSQEQLGIFPTISSSTWLLHFVSPNACFHICIQVSSHVFTHISFLCVLIHILFSWISSVSPKLSPSGSPVTNSYYSQSILLRKGTMRYSDRLKFLHLIDCFHPLMNYMEPVVTGIFFIPDTDQGSTTTTIIPASCVQYRDPYFTHQDDWAICLTYEFLRMQFCLSDPTLIPSGLPTYSSSYAALLTQWITTVFYLYEDLISQN